LQRKLKLTPGMYMCSSARLFAPARQLALALPVAALFALLLLCPGIVSAQTSKGAIAGTVTDKSGAVVIGAQITATNSDTGEARNSLSGQLGQYRIDAVEPGRYLVAIRQLGFTPLLLEGIRVSGSVLTSVNARLIPSEVVQTIVVEAPRASVQTESGELSQTIGTRELHDIPAPVDDGTGHASLNPYAFAATLPGCSTVTDGSFSFVNGVSFSCNGARPRDNNFLIEGQDNNDLQIRGQGLQPQNMESVQEVTFLLNSASAEYGHGGGAIANLIVKSGTNAFHGALWERLSNSALDANDRANQIAGTPKNKYRESWYGFSIGGPLKRDKLFFFTSFQWDNYRSSRNGGTLTLPSAAGFATLEQYAASNPRIAAMLAAYGPLRGDPTRFGHPVQIPLGPDPVTGVDRGAVEMGLFNRTGVPVRADSPQFDANADYLISPRDTLSLRYIRSSFNTPDDFFHFANNLPGFDAQQSGAWHHAGITYAHIFSPRLLNEARLSYGRMGLSFLPRPDNLAAALGPTVVIDGVQGWGANPVFPQGRFHNTYQVQDSVSWTRGAHVFKFGFDVAKVRARDMVPGNWRGSIQYMAGGAYQALANYMDDYSGGTSSVAQTFGSPIVHSSVLSQAYFAQDSWKLRPNLTVEIGLRYEYNGTPANQLRYPAVDPNNLACFPCVVKQRGDKQNFGPRVAFAYSPNFWKRLFGEGQSVLRGGFGIFYDSEFTNILDNSAATSPNAVASAATKRADATRGVANWSAQLSQLSTVPNARATEQSQVAHLLSPEFLQWHLDFQRELPGKFILDAGYVGTRGEHLFANTFSNPFLPDGSRLIPGRGTILIRDNSGDSMYHAVQLQLNRRYSHGLLVRTSYTLSKLIDDGSEVFNSGTSVNGAPGTWWSVPPVEGSVDDQGVFTPLPRGATDRSLSNFDHRHRLAFTYVYEIPAFSTRDWFTTKLGHVLNGWQISGTTSFQSGTPYNVTTGFDTNGDGVPNDRPSLANPQAPLDSYAYAGVWASRFTLLHTSPPNGTYCDGPTLFVLHQCTPVSLGQVHWLVPANGQGNVGRNSLTGPWYNTWAFALTRTIQIREGHRLQMRAEVFNPFNQAHGDGDGYWPEMRLVSGIVPAGSAAHSTFADFATSRHGGRTMRMLMKYSF